MLSVLVTVSHSLAYRSLCSAGMPVCSAVCTVQFGSSPGAPPGARARCAILRLSCTMVVSFTATAVPGAGRPSLMRRSRPVAT